MDPRRLCRNLLLSLVPIWVGCTQVPSRSPSVEQSGSGVAVAMGTLPKPDASAAPGSRPLVDEKIGQAGVNGRDRPDADTPSSTNTPLADSAPRLTPAGG